ncbi:DUF6616 family protein [Methylobacterium nodulans]|uniref:Uncharacterized protein n=1 Tax=Methylobacterium nodulans (strain LMG 21967 / CNCM I-2342 / ORS 2060) TaxID=460265 RepID=B8IL93_METNO|nr:DUF6616 family protein [Methylobacterium nodulans]ACL60092.1 conserved hypothetical protein [Methylobacterium nodulans ORS 2060]
MHHMLIELYAPKPAWLRLDADARQAVFSRIGEGMGAILALGIEPLAFGEIAGDVANSAGQRFFAVWRAPDRSALDALVEGIAASGWHDYFETVNAAGEAVDLTAHLGQLAAA